MALSISIHYHTDYDNDSLSASYSEATFNAPLTEDLLPELTNKDYLFQGWYSTPTFNPESKVTVGTIVTGELHLYAKWVLKNELDNKMTLLADEIRELSGTTEAMSLGTMKTYVNEANDEVALQVELLTQAVTALEGKAGGGNGDNDYSDELVTVTLKNGDLHTTIVNVFYTGANREYNILQFELAETFEEQTIEVIKNSVLVISNKNIELKSSGKLIINESYPTTYVAIDNIYIDIANS